MKIKAFLDAPRRYRWGGVGGDDCVTFMAAWGIELTGRDAMAALRGTYAGKDAAYAIVAADGGMVPLVDRLFSQIGARRVQIPEDGDIAIVTERDGHEVGAIRFGPLWAMMSPHGVIAKAWPAKAVWRLPHA